MGAVAARLADRVYVTDDNPRSEDPATIRKAIMTTVPSALEIGDRGDAIQTAIGTMARGDLLIIAGKGHEEGQIIGETVLPFSDRDAVRDALGAHDNLPLGRRD